MKSNQWIADCNTEVATPKIQAIVKVSEWEKYEYAEINNMKFIKGSSSKQDSELFEFKTIDNIGILIDLLSLKNQLQVQYTNDEKIISKNITDNDIEVIIKFCKRWGLARWGEPPIYNYCINEQQHTIIKKHLKIIDKILSENHMPKDEFTEKLYDITKNLVSSLEITSTTLLREIIPFATENYLHIPSFIRAISWLKTDFLHFVAAHNLENDNNIKPLILESDKQRLDSIRHNKHFDMYMPNLHPFATYWDNDKNGLFLNCENLIHLATYYLCAMQQTGKSIGGHIKVCQSCGRLFVTPNANRKFCGTADNWGCTRQAAWQRKERLKNKVQTNLL